MNNSHPWATPHLFLNKTSCNPSSMPGNLILDLMISMGSMCRLSKVPKIELQRSSGKIAKQVHPSSSEGTKVQQKVSELLSLVASKYQLQMKFSSCT